MPFNKIPLQRYEKIFNAPNELIFFYNSFHPGDSVRKPLINFLIAKIYRKTAFSKRKMRL